MGQPTLYLFMGYPGAGKTTVARLIHQLTGAAHIWADHERFVLYGAASTHSEAESELLYTNLNQQAQRLLEAGQDVLYDTNFNYFKDRQLLREIAHQAGAKTIVIWMITDRPLAHERATKESAGKAIRVWGKVWGNMTNADFDRLSSKLEPPQEHETVIKINGVDVTEDTIKSALNLTVS